MVNEIQFSIKQDTQDDTNIAQQSVQIVCLYDHKCNKTPLILRGINFLIRVALFGQDNRRAISEASGLKSDPLIREHRIVTNSLTVQIYRAMRCKCPNWDVAVASNCRDILTKTNNYLYDRRTDQGGQCYANRCAQYTHCHITGCLTLSVRSIWGNKLTRDLKFCIGVQYTWFY